MVDREKVIKGLECCTNNGVVCFSDCPYCKEFTMADGRCITALQADALALLKDQEAKPVIVTNAYGTRFYHCPKCNRDLYAYIRQRYCSNCGQKVKWE